MLDFSLMAVHQVFMTGEPDPGKAHHGRFNASYGRFVSIMYPVSVTFTSVYFLTLPFCFEVL